MCTVIIRVPAARGEAVHLLAVRDEDPQRAWDPLGARWPELPGVVGVRDARAGGAWLAADPDAGRLAVLLNRADVSRRPEEELVSRGGIALASVAGASPVGEPATHGFNLVEVDGSAARVVTWDGAVLRTTGLAPGTHMIAHDDVDDPGTARIARWLGAFARAALPSSAQWWAPWLEILAGSAALPADDERAIVRDNRPLGYPTLSTLLCVAAVAPGTADVRYAALREPGRWDAVTLA
ncbi:NRDE family protein [Microbacterium sp.]|uniref:NRDE family protein n=1 Tax=Microbacterium sp. TaxID=51671 RepID=UPI0039E3A215